MKEHSSLGCKDANETSMPVPYPAELGERGRPPWYCRLATVLMMVVLAAATAAWGIPPAQAAGATGTRPHRSDPPQGGATTFLNRGNSASSRTIHAEYLAESAEAPMFMVRRGSCKYIDSSADPRLLYNVDDDSNELQNRAADPRHADLVAELQAYIATKRNNEKLTGDIVLSQRRRRLILQANANGTAPCWNHGESPE